ALMRPCRGAPTPPPAHLPADSLGLRPTRGALVLGDQVSALPRAPRMPRPPPSRRATGRAARSSRARRRDPRRRLGRPERGARPAYGGGPPDGPPRRGPRGPPPDPRAGRPRTPPIAPGDDESAHGCLVRATRPAPPVRPLRPLFRAVRRPGGAELDRRPVRLLRGARVAGWGRADRGVAAGSSARAAS